MSEIDFVWVVAPGVTVYCGSGEVFPEGEVITRDDVGNQVQFRCMVAARKIIRREAPAPGPGQEAEWDRWTIDGALDETSPNPVKNSALAPIIYEIYDSRADAVPLEDIDALFE